MTYFIHSSIRPLPAATPYKLVEYFHQSSHVGRQLTLPAYMIYLAHLFEDFSDGLVLNIDSPELLVHDLIAYGWLFMA